MNNFFNTISLEGEKLEAANAKALEQAELILEIFQANPGVLISPSQMLSVFTQKYNENVPLTSIRRAMTNLTQKDDKLIKTAKQRIGLYGSPEHYWVLKTSEEITRQQVMKQEGTSAGDHAIKIINSSSKPYLEFDPDGINI